ncbi:MAG: hypothetical protein HND44_21545 [Chloroflexi bacterium]|nr:hypothetical protein [Ardenticatenaceae bacterium]NOG37126.1 hypothetical protein [Chloroflexota bacterium]
MKRKNKPFLFTPVLALLLAIGSYLLLRPPTPTYASCGSGPYIANTDITAYAMGNLTGAAYWHTLVIGDAAGKVGRYPFGTCIYLPYNSVTIKTYNGGSTAKSSFYIWDTGYGTADPDWVDIYHGRYKRYGQSCNCSGVPPGVCYDNAVTNSCDEAWNFGYKSWVIVPDSG